MTDDTVRDVAKREATRQAIILVFSIAGTIGSVYLVKKFTEPDTGKTLKMMTALHVKRFAGRNVDFWQRIADRAATAYNREKP